MRELRWIVCALAALAFVPVTAQAGTYAPAWSKTVVVQVVR